MSNLSTEPTTDLATATGRRPGWTEVLVAAAAYGLLLLLTPPIVRTVFGDDSVNLGLAYAALSGIMGLAAFFAAFGVRIRDRASFGVRRVSWTWLLAGALLGLAALLVTRIAAIVFVALGGDVAADPQGDYRASAASGALGLVLNLLFLAILTPIGEELAFRGVVANALDRYPAWISIVASTAIFALAHGINLALIPAVTVGLITAILFRRTGSVFPGMITHAVNNGLGMILSVVLGSLAAA